MTGGTSVRFYAKQKANNESRHVRGGERRDASVGESCTRRIPLTGVSSSASFSINASFEVALRDDTYRSSVQRRGGARE